MKIYGYNILFSRYNYKVKSNYKYYRNIWIYYYILQIYQIMKHNYKGKSKYKYILLHIHKGKSNQKYHEIHRNYGHMHDSILWICYHIMKYNYKRKSKYKILSKLWTKCGVSNIS